MDDLISRQAAIDALIAELKEKPETYIDNGLNQYDIESVLTALPSAQPERLTGKWAPCSERLPEMKGTYLVTVGDDIEPYTNTDMWSGTGFWEYGKRAVAWMPFPEPWKEEEG